MNDDDRTRLIDLLEGTLPPGERAALEARLAEEPALVARRDRLARLRGALQAARPDGFGPYFSLRVAQRLDALAAPPADPLYEAMRWVFARAAVAVLIVAIALGVFNVIDYQGTGVAASVLEALFGLPSDSLMHALTYAA